MCVLMMAERVSFYVLKQRRNEKDINECIKIKYNNYGYR